MESVSRIHHCGVGEPSIIGEQNFDIFPDYRQSFRLTNSIVKPQMTKNVSQALGVIVEYRLTAPASHRDMSHKGGVPGTPRIPPLHTLVYRPPLSIPDTPVNTAAETDGLNGYRWLCSRALFPCMPRERAIGIVLSSCVVLIWKKGVGARARPLGHCLLVAGYAGCTCSAPSLNPFSCIVCVFHELFLLASLSPIIFSDSDERQGGALCVTILRLWRFARNNPDERIDANLDSDQLEDTAYFVHGCLEHSLVVLIGDGDDEELPGRVSVCWTSMLSRPTLQRVK
ncbi:uncharacterized protein BDR25DRAFT_355753 [Lindgomyces ingoldianus]|uniref:Uncharacterized protein n=1 Tax=Lindgomyces ingoldianus TaxID=673940 RepID=A0ACB6QT56_9PLEO|nr:uncharacterized protein BDR25DRAFT_355753 [Lindgomyces ingoldianus]KAF2470027.1 hypothetical protein BDR25DRAFT_355753 [Lindgomyces ingoldianus]